ncbi:DUF3105 domain-containing protein [Streptomyces sp. NPDC049916]|uniref:DUF3105 domain-containing protein n=1 Tax=Streptomyces sp. NPDC049916 TaxID=3155156 RepID=UPI00343E311E
MSLDPRHPQPQAPEDPPRPTRNRAIAIGAGAVVVAGLVAFGSYLLLGNSAADGKSGGTAAAQDGKHPGGHGDAHDDHTDAAIDGLKSWDAAKLGRDHVAGAVDYPMKPPVGGDHNQSWMNCDGDVYEKALPDVNAVHSLEHGAVWVTHNGKAADADVAKLAERVKETPFTLMSPYEGQEGAIVLSAWGKQVTVDGADDERVDHFFGTFVQGAQTPEPGAPCTGGLATVPR